jgi:hypothetical protein
MPRKYLRNSFDYLAHPVAHFLQEIAHADVPVYTVHDPAVVSYPVRYLAWLYRLWVVDRGLSEAVMIPSSDKAFASIIIRYLLPVAGIPNLPVLYSTNRGIRACLLKLREAGPVALPVKEGVWSPIDRTNSGYVDLGALKPFVFPDPKDIPAYLGPDLDATMTSVRRKRYKVRHGRAIIAQREAMNDRI